MADNLSLTYGGVTLSDSQVRYIVKNVVDKLACVGSFPLVCFFSESRWGTSTVGQSCNNWAGMSYTGSKQSNIKRDSGVTCYKCLARPSGEGGAYFGYNSFPDFLTDWIYLFRRQGYYRVYGKKSFAECVKGMFKYGGAIYDYAVSSNNSQSNYNSYFSLMNGVRNSINANNNNLLDKIDSGNVDWGDDPPQWNQPYPDDTDDESNIIKILENLLSDAQNGINELAQEIIKALLDAMNSNLYDNSKKVIANKNVKIDKLMDNMYLMRSTGVFNSALQDLQGLLGDFNNEINDQDQQHNPQVNPNGDKPFHPTNGVGYISSHYGHRTKPKEGATTEHAAIDIAAPAGTPVYATQSGVVTDNRYGGSAGWLIRIRHTGDPYYSNYQHLLVQSPIPVGTNVTKGQQIGQVGSTGNSTGNHLHFDISINGTFYNYDTTIDPEKYLQMTF